MTASILTTFYDQVFGDRLNVYVGLMMAIV
jgi:hypothetical protein